MRRFKLAYRNLRFAIYAPQPSGLNAGKSFPVQLASLPSLASRNFATANGHQSVLYERNPDTYFQPRIALSLSWLSCVYSSWYALDFLPIVNMAGIPDLYVSPVVGAVGCSITYLLAGAGCIYVRQMVSKIVLKEGSETPIHVYLHSPPFMFAASQPMEFAYGGEASLDFASDDVKILMEKMDTNSSTMTGFIPLKTNNRRLPLAIHLSSMNDIKDKDLFRDTLIYSTMTKHKRRRHKMISNSKIQKKVRKSSAK